MGSFWKKLRVLIILLLLVGIGIQFIRPRLDNPPVTGDLQAPAEAKAILQRACYDCHSNEPRLAWFDEPAPAYWLVVKDIKAARAVLNFSNWDSLPKAQQAGKLFESISQIEQHAMPLSQYTLLHHGGIITADELAVLKKYALTLAYQPKLDPLREQAASTQYGQWIDAGGAVPDGAIAPLAAVKDAPNGIAYALLADWINWQTISTTERFDNGTLRVILGNDIAVKAVREGHINPYPDGTILAKAAYAQNPDPAGEIRSGAFVQVEFMIRDSKKYAKTFGWGWARWVKGLAMKPYGHDASFITECMNCHRPVAAAGYAFTFPLADTLRLYEGDAAVPDSMGGYPLRGKVITSYARDGVMSTLYGNTTAAGSARSGQTYPSGSVLSLVNWTQRDDPHWFGGRIPRDVRSVEVLRYCADGRPEYSLYTGPRLAKKEMDASFAEQRVQYIMAKKAAVVPIGVIDDRPN